MSICRVCTAPITWAETEEGEPVPIDDRETTRSGDNRWRLTGRFAESGRQIVEPARDEWPGETSIDHRVVCQRPRVV